MEGPSIPGIPCDLLDACKEGEARRAMASWTNPPGRGRDLREEMAFSRELRRFQ
jgi:hypothetical protein